MRRTTIGIILILALTACGGTHPVSQREAADIYIDSLGSAPSSPAPTHHVQDTRISMCFWDHAEVAAMERWLDKVGGNMDSVDQFWGDGVVDSPLGIVKEGDWVVYCTTIHLPDLEVPA